MILLLASFNMTILQSIETKYFEKLHSSVIKMGTFSTNQKYAESRKKYMLHLNLKYEIIFLFDIREPNQHK